MTDVNRKLANRTKQDETFRQAAIFLAQARLLIYRGGRRSAEDFRVRLGRENLCARLHGAIAECEELAAECR